MLVEGMRELAVVERQSGVELLLGPPGEVRKSDWIRREEKEGEEKSVAEVSVAITHQLILITALV